MPRPDLRIGFAGTPEFARVALQALIDAGDRIAWVLTQPDRPAGRGLKLLPSPVKMCASAQGLPVLQPAGLRLDGRHAAEAAAVQAQLASDPPDAVVVAAYGLILPPWLLTLPRLGCLNIHASLLPRWRGAAPIHRAIEAGDAETGISIMQMDAGLDTGDVLATERLTIGATETTGALHDRLAVLGGAAIVRAVDTAAAGGGRPVPQPADGVTYAHKIDKREAVVDWTLAATVIERRLRAFDPAPGAQSRLDGEVLKLWQGRAVDGIGAPGTVLAADAAGFVVACGVGALQIGALQRPGGKRVAARAMVQQWLQAGENRIGWRFEVGGAQDQAQESGPAADKR